MVLQCECGGVLEIENQSYSEKSAFESYKCVSCGRTGSMTHDVAGTRLTGCVIDR